MLEEALLEWADRWANYIDEPFDATTFRSVLKDLSRTILASREWEAADYLGDDEDTEYRLTDKGKEVLTQLKKGDTYSVTYELVGQGPATAAAQYPKESLTE